MHIMKIQIPYSKDQTDAFIDSCLYGLPYGYEFHEHEYIKAELKKLGYSNYLSLMLDDQNMMHIVEVSNGI